MLRQACQMRFRRIRITTKLFPLRQFFAGVGRQQAFADGESSAGVQDMHQKNLPNLGRKI